MSFVHSLPLKLISIFTKSPTFNVGDLVKIDINLRGREWTNDKGEIKYFNSIQGWRIEKVEDDFESQLPPLPTKEDLNISESSENEPDDLPF